jgi:hypothetical protein
MNGKEFCDRVVTIPQYLSTCWFNAVLMTLLYSQNSRKLLLHNNIYATKKDNKLYEIINEILTKKYVNQEKAMEYFKIMRPEKILDSFYTNKIHLDKVVNVGGVFYRFLPFFIDYIGKTCITLDNISTKDYYINLVKSLSENEREKAFFNGKKTTLDSNLEKFMNELNEKNPDYILVNFERNTSFFSTYIKEDKYKKYILKNTKFEFKGLEKLEKYITFNGDRYILDSCILGNYQIIKKGGHAIAGITCKDNRYVYNGWIRTTNDKVMGSDKVFKNDTMPCELMKFDWNVNDKNYRFCLNRALCKLNKLDKTDEKSLCFSFGKGRRTLIYVKMNKDYQSFDDDEKIDTIKQPSYKGRSTVFKKYKKILDKDDNRHLKQQLFLKKYTAKNYKTMKNFLLYHGIGTGKTRSSIIMAEEIMKKDPNKSVVVILPARLKTNYMDELIPIICKNKQDELDEYYNVTTTITRKNELKAIFLKKINKKYSIFSYEYIVNQFKKSNDIKSTLKELVDNKIIIIDEVHNLISNYINNEILNKFHTENKITRLVKNINAVVLRYITTYAQEVSNNYNIIFLTATPVFDNINQFIELIYLLNPLTERSIKKKDVIYTLKMDNTKENKTLKYLIQFLKGLVSYYFITDLKDFPSVKYKTEKIRLSKLQDKKTFEIIQGGEGEEKTNDLFLISQRQVSISVYNYDKVDEVLKNLKECAPKIYKLITLINKNKGKHVVYSNFIQYCLYLIKKYFDENGWVNYTDEYKTKPYKTYVLWDASLDDNNKQRVKLILNSVENMDGKLIRVVLGSPSIKEGISFKHCQHLHQIDPVWNPSAKEQIEGRCIRYKSHEEIPLDHPFLKREVVIHNYKSIPKKEEGLVKQTCDERIYDEIMPKKSILLTKINNALKKIAIDHHLYNNASSIKTKTFTNSISINSDDNIDFLKKVINKKVIQKNTCPKARRPDDDNKCPSDKYKMKLNKQNFPCCYIKKKSEL